MYYILADLLEIPNLRQKATSLWQRMMGALLLGLPQPYDPFLPQRRQVGAVPRQSRHVRNPRHEAAQRRGGAGRAGDGPGRARAARRHGREFPGRARHRGEPVLRERRDSARDPLRARLAAAREARTGRQELGARSPDPRRALRRGAREGEGRGRVHGVLARGRDQCAHRRAQGVRAIKIQDLAARVRELERIRAAYPSTPYKALIESAILYARIQMATTVEEVLRLHEPVIRGADGMNRVFVFYSFSWDILRHPNAARFDKAKAARAVLDYVGRGVKLSRDPEFQKTLPPGELPYHEVNRPVFFLTEAAAHIFAGNTDRAAAALENFRKSGHALDQVYHYVQGDLDAAKGRDKEALESF